MPTVLVRVQTGILCVPLQQLVSMYWNLYDFRLNLNYAPLLGRYLRYLCIMSFICIVRSIMIYRVSKIVAEGG